MGNLCDVVFRNNGKLSRPSGTFTSTADAGRRISLDRQRLWNNHCHFLLVLCNFHVICRKVYRLDGNQERICLVNCCLVCRGGTSCIVWCINRKMGRITRCRCVTGCSCRNRPCGYDQYGKCYVLYYSTLCAGSW